nr:MAG TPA: hypothetical protein [Caudoviricetes sp.]
MISAIFPAIVVGLFWSVCAVVLLIALVVVVKILVLVVRGLTDEE